MANQSRAASLDFRMRLIVGAESLIASLLTFCVPGLRCPLLGVKRTSKTHAAMSAFDPKRTLAAPVARQGGASSDLPFHQLWPSGLCLFLAIVVLLFPIYQGGPIQMGEDQGHGIRPPQLLADHNLTSIISSMEPKDVLCDIGPMALSSLILGFLLSRPIRQPHQAS